MDYTLSEETAGKLKRILQTKPGDSGAYSPQNFGHPHFSFVKVTGSLSSGRYPCITAQMLNDGTWDDFGDAGCYVYPNGATLTSGTRYFALQIADDTSGNPQWVCVGGGGGGSVSVSCDADGHLVVVTS